MSILTFIAEDTLTTVLLAPQATGTGAVACVNPAAGSSALNVRAIATMGNAADLVLSLVSADDAAGANPVAFASVVPLYVDGVKQTRAIAHTIGDATGEFVVDFCVDPALIPDGKFVGISYANSNAGNLLTTIAIEAATEHPVA